MGELGFIPKSAWCPALLPHPGTDCPDTITLVHTFLRPQNLLAPHEFVLFLEEFQEAL